ncbi:IS30 family transposase [Mycobacteroides chelonae]|uniref:IS30 family transposase n=1 Tax=Mycobacteroides chelonae TaxID=1774 RepID=A0A1S1LLW9_MYCCH|nr:IS30 family transposase [Mycobacteroides chelonae]OHU47626.1 IS30 family transposase [Mycobacteroides chelonae]OHU61239.1 IS30 family transposase [Mycobacteroides chelonae]OHU68752.1 IS30 family transposase [Mycobacteroides chelonae]
MFEVRASRVAQGRKKLVAERVKFFELLAQGYGVRESSKIIGVNYRTVKRWRSGDTRCGHTNRAGRPAQPYARTYRLVSSRYLSVQNRIVIADALSAGESIRSIAATLGRSPSTISREVRRNRHPDTGAYRPYAAQDRAEGRRPRPKKGKIARNGELRAFIQRHLMLRWSPEQIARTLRRQFADRPEMHVTHETIYLALYVHGRGELRRELTKALRTGRAYRKTRRQAQRRQPRYADPMVMISERPSEVADRAVPGHWEGDLIIGKNHQSAIGTLVERSTRYVMLLHLPASHNAGAVQGALLDAISTLPTHLRRSLTWDQGSEMGLHKQFSIAADMPVYFCDPGSPWQRGTNENTNGLLRQYFPKGTDLSLHTRANLDAVATELNSRPRKSLDWDTPAQRLATLIDVAA